MGKKIRESKKIKKCALLSIRILICVLKRPYLGFKARNTVPKVTPSLRDHNGAQPHAQH